MHIPPGFTTVFPYIFVKDAPRHCASAVHSTHCPNFAFAASVSHTGRAPLHATPSSAAVHARQPAIGGARPSQMIVALEVTHAPSVFDHSPCTVYAPTVPVDLVQMSPISP